jgi:hypothetical protein
VSILVKYGLIVYKSVRANGFQKLLSLHTDYLPVNQFVFYHLSLCDYESVSQYLVESPLSVYDTTTGRCNANAVKVQKDECR